MKWLALVAMGGFFGLPAFASVVVGTNEYKGEIAPGETVFRDIAAPEPAPYVATAPFAVAFVPKVEVPSETWDVVIIRLNLFVGSHRAVYALDIGGLGSFADYKMDGVGVAGLFNYAGESDGAIQVAGLFNYTGFNFCGCQIAGFYNRTEGRHSGLQISGGNYAGHLVGLQIGVVNYAERLDGVQIGFINYGSSAPVPFMPVINIGF